MNIATSVPTRAGRADGSALIAAIAPKPAAAYDTRSDLLPDAPLFPGEPEIIANAVDSRRNEFITARTCARRAMQALGAQPTAILPGAQGEPQWPAGLVGSITHCAGYRGAVLGRDTDFASIGIDAEPDAPLPAGVLEAISLEQERIHTAELLLTHPQVHWDRLLFCMKEAVYKVWYPLARCWLDFDDALITVDPDRGTFTARLRVSGASLHGRRLTGFSGHWLARDGLLFTSIIVPQPTAARAPAPARVGR